MSEACTGTFPCGAGPAPIWSNVIEVLWAPGLTAADATAANSEPSKNAKRRLREAVASEGHMALVEVRADYMRTVPECQPDA